MSSLTDYQKHERSVAKTYGDNHAASLRKKAKTVTDTIDKSYNTAIGQVTDSYKKAKRDTESSYRAVYDRNALGELALTRQMNERLANMGLQNSGLRVAQQASIRSRRERTDKQITAHKQNAMGALTTEYETVRKNYETERDTKKQQVLDATEAAISKKYKELEEQADAQAQTRYEQDESIRKALESARVEAETYTTPEPPPDPDAILKAVRLETVEKLNSGSKNAMTDTWTYLSDRVRDKTITSADMNNIMREFGVLSPSQQEYFTDRAGNFRYEVPVSTAQLKTTARKERESEGGTTTVDEAYINAFFADYKDFVDGALSAFDTIGYHNAASVSKSYAWQGKDLETRGNEVLRYLNEQREVIGEEQFAEFAGYVEDMLTGQQMVQDQLRTYVDTIAEFDSKQAYEEALKGAEFQNYLENCDIGDEKKQLEALESSYEWLDFTIFKRDNLFNSQLSDDVVMPQIDAMDKQIERILKRYDCGNLDEFAQVITKKRSDILQAEYVQTGNRLTEDAVKASDFEKFSKIDHTDTITEKYRKHLTQEQSAVYNYYYEKGGEKAADTYLHFIEAGLKTKLAKENAEAMKGKPIRQWASAFEAGADSFVNGIAGLFRSGDEWVSPSVAQQQAALVRQDLYGDGGADGTIARGVYDVISATSNMLPSVLTSAAVSLINPAAGAATGTLLMSASAAGNAYTEAINRGYDKGQARLFSTLVGASEGCLQLALGGISKLGGVGTKQVISAINGIENGLARVSLKLGTQMVAEGCEEALQEMLTPLFEKAALGHSEGINWEAITEAFVIGGLTAGLLEGRGTVRTDINTRMAGEAILKSGNLAGLRELASMMPKDSKAYRMTEVVHEKSGYFHIGEMFAAVCDSLNVTEAAGNMSAQQVSERTPAQLQEEQQRVDQIVSQMIGRDITAAPVPDNLQNIVRRLTEAVRDFRKAEIFSDPFAAPAIPRGIPPVTAQTAVPVVQTNSNTVGVDAHIDPQHTSDTVTPSQPTATTPQQPSDQSVGDGSLSPVPQKADTAKQSAELTQPDVGDGVLDVPTEMVDTSLQGVDKSSDTGVHKRRRKTSAQQADLFEPAEVSEETSSRTEPAARPYMVFHEATIGETKSRSSHRRRANKELYARLESDSDFRKQLDDMLGYDVMAYMKTGKGALKNPSPDLVWHHPIENRLAVELIWKKDHQDPKMQKYLHPAEGGRGGYGVYYK